MKNIILTLALCAGASIAVSADNSPLWLRNPRISPDGQNIVFTYKGDIFTVPATGGKANRLTSSSSYETAPIWSPDGKKIAFASDRHGNLDIYIMPAEGGNPSRLTFNSATETPEAFSPDGSRIFYSANIQAPAESAQFPSGRLTQVYSVPVDGGHPRQETGTPANAIAFLPSDPSSFLYQDVKGFENIWRKHHTSSVTRDIWLYDASTGEHANLTNRPGEDRNPVISPDGKTLYFLSERDGLPFNIYSVSLSPNSRRISSEATRLTGFTPHPVRSLSLASNGTLAFTYDGELFTLTPGGSPSKVPVEIVIDEVPQTERINVSASYGVPSPDGKQVAFTSRGEVFVTSAEHSSTRRITDTPAAEKQIAWHPDGRKIAYTSMRDGHYNIYTASIARKEDPNFSNATLIDEKPVVAVDDIERTVPKYSPDGKQIAFIEGRHRLMVMDLASGKTHQLADDTLYPYSDGSFDYEWSPDSKWITLAVMDNKHTPYSDIAIINVKSGELTHLTRTGYTDEAPIFVMDGNAILYLTERYGMRSHASWGSQQDAALIFLNRDAYDRFRLSKEDYELRKEIEKQKKPKDKPAEASDSNKSKKSKDSKKDNKESKEKDGESDETTGKDIVFEPDGISDRIVRLTPYSSNLAGAWVDKDGRTLYYLSKHEKGYDLWKMNFDDRKPSIAASLDMGAANLYPSADGKALYIMGNKMTKFDTSSSKTTNISGSSSMVLDHAAEREAMFDQVYISEREMFYNKGMHGVDWDAMTAAYRRFLPHINNNYDFAEMLSEWLGELNVSHTGGYFSGSDANAEVDRTASLGLLYDMTYDGDGLKVSEVVTGGPFDNASSRIGKGSIITRINDTRLKSDNDLISALNNLAGRKTLVTFTAPGSNAQVEEVILPISAGAMNSLMYDRWVQSRAAFVDSISGGRLGYVHIKSMDDASFREIYADILGKYNQREGIVVDVRWNGGGRLHEDVEILLSGHKYFTQEIRGTDIGDMPSRRSNLPSVMVIAEACYSNAHGTPWVYKNRNIGKLVGMPVPGTMTSVNWVNLQDPSMRFGIPVVGYRLPDGSYLENQQLEPDIRIENLPQDIIKGEDAQLRAAVKTLLDQLDR